MTTKTAKAMLEFYIITMYYRNPERVTVESIDTVQLPSAKAAEDLVNYLNTLYTDNADECRWVEYKAVEHVVIADPRVLIKRVEDAIDEEMQDYDIGD